ncbi:MAG: single-stranded-DNA-specific exonuclease RecJ [Verrucomicrobiota bacterium]
MGVIKVSRSRSANRFWHIIDELDDRSSLTTAEVIEVLLGKRGFSESDSSKFLYPKLKHLSDPFRIPDMALAVERIEKALRRDERVLIYTDYDVDGMSSGALLYRFLVELGAQVEVFIPERQSEGYGLSLEGLEHSLEKGPIQLIIALDCGTTSIEEVDWVKSQGIDILIIDHHELAETIPAADAVVNPQRGETDQYLSTVGLIFKLCHAFLKAQGDPELFDLRSHMDYVALGTVSDLVPLVDDNRIMVYYGLKQLGITHHIGLQELMRVAKVRKVPDPSTIGFVIGPRLNASGRLTSAEEGWELLVTQDHSAARRIAQSLDALNRKRQKIELEAYEAAKMMASEMQEEERSHCLIVDSTDWHQGVVGIVASRLQRDYYLPSIVITVDEDGMGKGSARSIPGLSMMEALRAHSNYLKAFGGHSMAAGLEIEHSSVPEFRKAMNQWFAENTSDSDYQERLLADMSVPAQILDRELAEGLSTMEPFGQGNPAPVLVVRKVRMKSPPRYFGTKHIKFKAVADQNTFDAVGFGLGSGDVPEGPFDLAGHWEMDSFTGRPIFRISDWRW